MLRIRQAVERFKGFWRMWHATTGNVQLGGGEVHVWKIRLDLSVDIVQALANHLSSDEMDRADRIHFGNVRSQYVVARGTLREILGEYLGVRPGTVRLTYSAHGKPELADTHGTDLQFNLAHSGNLALVAVTRAAPVGVDIERARNEFDGQRIADRFFTQEEAAMLRAVPLDLRAAAFLQQWTRKECFIKARGEGLSFPLNAFAVLQRDGALSLQIHADMSEAGRWSIRDLPIDEEGYAACLAVAHPAPELHLFDMR